MNLPKYNIVTKNKSWIFFSLFSLTFCQKDTGKLAFAVVDENLMTPLEAKNFIPRRFYLFHDKTLFPAGKKIWFVYIPPLEFRVYGKTTFAISLQKKSLGYLEIDLRNKTISPLDPYLRDFYENLEPGDYRLRISANAEVLVEKDFEVIESQDSDFIDYEKELSDEEENEDEILKLSR